MGVVFVELSMSLDGFVTGPNDGHEHPLGEGGERLFKWYSSGDAALSLPATDMVFRVPRASADLLGEEWGSVGAMVAGRRMFDIANAWGGNPPGGGGPCFIVTHHPPAEWLNEGSPFTFVTDGAESGIRQAKQAAGDKDVSVSSASIMQQALKAGLLDEVRIDLAPLLIGRGVRLFENFGSEPVDLEIIRVVHTPVITHLRYRVVK